MVCKAIYMAQVGQDYIQYRDGLNLLRTITLLIFWGESLPGYSVEGTLGYGYPRFGTECEINYTHSAGGVTLKANTVAGGTISELTWNSKQFVNNYDYGRQIQTAFNFSTTGEYDNPTEGGSKYGCPGQVSAGRAQGSPLLDIDSYGSTLYTKTRPLTWNPDVQGGGSNNPVIWNGTIEKEVTLNYDTSYAAHVIKWTTTINNPSSRSNFSWEIVTAYLNAEFNKLWSYDAVSDTEVNESSNVPNNLCLFGSESPNVRLRPSAGGAIISTSDENYALGVYRKKATENHFNLCKFLNSSTTGKYGNDTTKWAVQESNYPYTLSAGVHSATAYLVVGTLSDVIETMRGMYLDGY